MELDFIYDEILISGRQQKMTDSCVLIEVLPVTFIESVKWIKLRFEVLPSPPMYRGCLTFRYVSFLSSPRRESLKIREKDPGLVATCSLLLERNH